MSFCFLDHFSKYFTPGYEVTTLNECVDKGRIFITCTSSYHVIDKEHFVRMKEDAIVCNMGHLHIEINTKWLMDNCERDTIKPQVGLFFYFLLVWIM